MKQKKEARKQERLRKVLQRRETFAKMFFKRWCLLLLGAVFIAGIGTYGYCRYHKLSAYHDASELFMNLASDIQTEAGNDGENDFIQSAKIDLARAIDLSEETILGYSETSYVLIDAKTKQVAADSRLSVFLMVVEEDGETRKLYDCLSGFEENIYKDYIGAKTSTPHGVSAYVESYYLINDSEIIPEKVIFQDALGEIKKTACYSPEKGMDCQRIKVKEGGIGSLIFYGHGVANQADTMIETYVVEHLEAAGVYDMEMDMLSFGKAGFYFQRIISSDEGDYYLCGINIYHILNDRVCILIISGCIVLFLLATGIALLLAYRTHTLLKVRYQMEDERRRLTNAMAHDLKSPLMAISGYAENLKEHVHSEKREHYAEAITDSVQYMNGIISNVLDLAKLEEGNINLEKEQVELIEIAKELSKQYQLELEKKKITLEIKGKCLVQGNRQLLTQALDNLISNSVKYTPPAGNIMVEGSSDQFSIQNDSAEQLGVAPETLMQPFIKGDNSRGNLKGSGVGLAIVKSIADLHGFEMNIYCSDDRFEICIKIH